MAKYFTLNTVLLVVIIACLAGMCNGAYILTTFAANNMDFPADFVAAKAQRISTYGIGAVCASAMLLLGEVLRLRKASVSAK